MDGRKQRLDSREQWPNNGERGADNREHRWKSGTVGRTMETKGRTGWMDER